MRRAPFCTSPARVPMSVSSVVSETNRCILNGDANKNMKATNDRSLTSFIFSIIDKCVLELLLVPVCL